jgi:RimJ/RimL family protein N-acetyltransferase
MESTHLTGRSIVGDDLQFVSRVWNDDRVAPAVGGPRTDGQLSERIEQWTRHWQEHGFGVNLFHERETQLPIGWGGLQHSTIGIGDCLTVGYVIAPEVWGRGYATEIATAAVAHAFEILGVDRLYASVLSTNAASRRVLEKAGLSVHRDVDHGTHVEVVYAIER